MRRARILTNTNASCRQERPLRAKTQAAPRREKASPPRKGPSTPAKSAAATVIDEARGS